MKWLKMWILTLAAWSRREQVTKAINSGEPRPLAYQPDWLIGWAMLRYEGDMAPGARRLYTAAVSEWRRRKDAPVADPKALVTWGDDLPVANGMERWRVTIPRPKEGEVRVDDFIYVPGGLWTYIGHSLVEYGREIRVVLDIPIGSTPEARDTRVTVQRDSAAGP